MTGRAAQAWCFSKGSLCKDVFDYKTYLDRYSFVVSFVAGIIQMLYIRYEKVIYIAEIFLYHHYIQC